MEKTLSRPNSSSDGHNKADSTQDLQPCPSARVLGDSALGKVHFDREVNGQWPEGAGTKQADESIEEREDHGYDSSDDHVDCSPDNPKVVNWAADVEGQREDMFVCDEAAVRPAGVCPIFNELVEGLTEDLKFIPTQMRDLCNSRKTVIAVFLFANGH